MQISAHPTSPEQSLLHLESVLYLNLNSLSYQFLENAANNN